MPVSQHIRHAYCLPPSFFCLFFFWAAIPATENYDRIPSNYMQTQSEAADKKLMMALT